MNDPAAFITALGAFITAIATAIATLRKNKKTDEVGQAIQAELTNNHGSSFKDKIELTLDLVKSQGHQLGELRTDLSDLRGDLHNLRKDVSTLQTKEILK